MPLVGGAELGPSRLSALTRKRQLPQALDAEALFTANTRAMTRHDWERPRVDVAEGGTVEVECDHQIVVGMGIARRSGRPALEMFLLDHQPEARRLCRKFLRM